MTQVDRIEALIAEVRELAEAVKAFGAKLDGHIAAEAEARRDRIEREVAAAEMAVRDLLTSGS